MEANQKEMNPLQILQERLGLKPDGVIGRITFGALRMHWNLTGIQLAHLLGQCEHETGGWQHWEENLKYSKAALIRVWPSRYTEEIAARHQYKPSLIANHVYGGRMGNDQPNDGWTFRGRGAIQITGRNNYTQLSKNFQDPSILSNPNQVSMHYAFDSAKWFFDINWIWRYTLDLSEASILKVSQKINLGHTNTTAIPKGLQDRIKKTLYYHQFIT